MADAGVAGVMRRGRSQVGEKTMLEVLVPLADAIRRGDPPAALRRVAAEGVAASVPLRATKGRASFVGERSIGHIDPGCRSCELLLGAVLDGLGA
jgi:dihydroxyacetone kinase-like protein